MGTSALGGFVEGLQGGMEFRQKKRRGQQIEKALDYELAGMDAKYKADQSAYEKFGENYGGFEGWQPESWGSKMVGKVKGWFGGAPDAPAPAQPGTQAISNAPEPELRSPYSGGGMRFADGGAVRHMRKKYADGGTVEDEERMRRSYGDENYVTEAEAAENRAARRRGEHTNRNPYHQRYAPGKQAIRTSGGGVGEFARDVGRSVSERFKGTTEAALGGQKLTEDADRGLDSAQGAAEVGAATRRTGTAALTAAGETTAALGKDLYEASGAGPLVRGVGGFFGYGEGDEQEDAIRALPVGETPEQAADSIASQATEQQPTAAAPGGTTPGAAAPAIGGPTTGVEDDEIIDVNEIRHISPEDMPNKTTEEWTKERNFYAAQAVANGQSPLEAMKQVDQKQMRGFTMYGQQAFQLLRAGDATGAARALYAAYQYFPNGTDVKFGVQKGKDGRPVLVGMGTDEETGEPSGKPTVITAESLGVQIENMSNPEAFRAWTKDWRDMEQSVREYEEVNKPAAQSEATYRDRMGKAALNRSEADLIGARSGGGRGGLRQADFDRAYSEFSGDRELQSLLGGEEEAIARDLTAAMASLYAMSPGNYPGVIKFVMDSYDAGGMEQVEQDMAELGSR